MSTFQPSKKVKSSNTLDGLYKMANDAASEPESHNLSDLNRRAEAQCQFLMKHNCFLEQQLEEKCNENLRLRHRVQDGLRCSAKLQRRIDDMELIEKRHNDLQRQLSAELRKSAELRQQMELLQAKLLVKDGTIKELRERLIAKDGELQTLIKESFGRVQAMIDAESPRTERAIEQSCRLHLSEVQNSIEASKQIYDANQSALRGLASRIDSWAEQATARSKELQQWTHVIERIQLQLDDALQELAIVYTERLEDDDDDDHKETKEEEEDRREDPQQQQQVCPTSNRQIEAKEMGLATIAADLTKRYHQCNTIVQNDPAGPQPREHRVNLANSVAATYPMSYTRAVCEPTTITGRAQPSIPISCCQHTCLTRYPVAPTENSRNTTSYLAANADQHNAATSYALTYQGVRSGLVTECLNHPTDRSDKQRSLTDASQYHDNYCGSGENTATSTVLSQHPPSDQASSSHLSRSSFSTEQSIFHNSLIANQESIDNLNTTNPLPVSDRNQLLPQVSFPYHDLTLTQQPSSHQARGPFQAEAFCKKANACQLSTSDNVPPSGTPIIQYNCPREYSLETPSNIQTPPTESVSALSRMTHVQQELQIPVESQSRIMAWKRATSVTRQSKTTTAVSLATKDNTGTPTKSRPTMCSFPEGTRTTINPAQREELQGKFEPPAQREPISDRIKVILNRHHLSIACEQKADATELPQTNFPTNTNLVSAPRTTGQPNFLSQIGSITASTLPSEVVALPQDTTLQNASVEATTNLRLFPKTTATATTTTIAGSIVDVTNSKK